MVKLAGIAFVLLSGAVFATSPDGSSRVYGCATVSFAPGSAELSDSAKRTIARLIPYVIRLDHSLITVAATADSSQDIRVREDQTLPQARVHAIHAILLNDGVLRTQYRLSDMPQLPPTRCTPEPGAFRVGLVWFSGICIPGSSLCGRWLYLQCNSDGCVESSHKDGPRR